MDKKSKGSTLLDQVLSHLELHEREYFGLMFNDSGTSSLLPSGHSPDVMRWLDTQKPVRKQMRSLTGMNATIGREKTMTAGGGGGSSHGSSMPTLYFRVKFYVTGKANKCRVSLVKRRKKRAAGVRIKKRLNFRSERFLFIKVSFL